jgi:hypothetical protein
MSFNKPFKITIKEAIDRGYLRLLEGKGPIGYKCYQFYRVEYPYIGEKRIFLSFGNKREPQELNVKLFIKDFVDINRAEISIKTDCEKGQGYHAESNNFLNLFIEDQPKEIQIDFTTALVQSNRLPVNIYVKDLFIYNNRDHGDFHISIEGESKHFDTFRIENNEATKLSISYGAEIKNLSCLSNKNVSLFVDEPVEILQFMGISPKNPNSKDHYAIGVGLKKKQSIADDLALDDKFFKQISISNLKLDSQKNNSNIERTYRLALYSSYFYFENTDINFSCLEENLTPKDGKALVPLYLGNLRDEGTIFLKGIQLKLGDSILFDSKKVHATWSDTCIDVKPDRVESSYRNLIRADSVDFSYDSKTAFKNVYINIDEGNGSLSLDRNNGFFDSTICVHNAAKVSLTRINTKNSYIYNDFERRPNSSFSLCSLNIEHTELFNCALPQSGTNYIKSFIICGDDKKGNVTKELLDGRFIVLDNCDFSGIKDFRVSVEDFDPLDKDKAIIIKNSKFDSNKVKITQQRNATTTITNTIFTQNESSLFLNTAGKRDNFYEINNSVIGGEVSINAEEASKIDNSVIKDSAILSHEHLDISDSTISDSELLGCSSVHDVYMVKGEEVKATEEKIVINREIELL